MVKLGHLCMGDGEKVDELGYLCTDFGLLSMHKCPNFTKNFEKASPRDRALLGKWVLAGSARTAHEAVRV